MSVSDFSIDIQGFSESPQQIIIRIILSVALSFRGDYYI